MGWRRESQGTGAGAVEHRRQEGRGEFVFVHIGNAGNTETNIIQTTKINKQYNLYCTSEGTQPSDAANVMLSSLAGRWRVDLLPRMHRMAERRIEKERRQRIHPMTTKYGFRSFLENRSANLL